MPQNKVIVVSSSIKTCNQIVPLKMLLCQQCHTATRVVYLCIGFWVVKCIMFCHKVVIIETKHIAMLVCLPGKGLGKCISANGG